MRLRVSLGLPASGACAFGIMPYIISIIILTRGQPLRRRPQFGALATIAFQAALISSGNLSFLNLLTIVPCIACLDDAFLAACLRFGRQQRAQFQALTPPHAKPMRAPGARHGLVALLRRLRPSFTVVVLAAHTLLTVPSAYNLFDPALRVPSVIYGVHAVFGPLNVANTYNSGRFARVTRERFEVVLEALSGEGEGGGDGGSSWWELELRCKTGKVDAAPCITVPFHPRLAWQFWFLQFENSAPAWLRRLTTKILLGDPDVSARFGLDARRPPRTVRASLHRYRFAPLGSGSWWTRERVRTCVPRSRCPPSPPSDLWRTRRPRGSNCVCHAQYRLSRPRRGFIVC